MALMEAEVRKKPSILSCRRSLFTQDKKEKIRLEVFDKAIVCRTVYNFYITKNVFQLLNSSVEAKR
jgi:hypothetical protein